jgi:RimJ/RimL family protein N-acetyltransferase
MILITDRLLLREFQKDDWRAVLAYQSDPQFYRYYPWKRRTEEDARRFVRSFIEWSREEPRKVFHLAIVLSSEERFIGNCGVRIVSLEGREAEFGCELSPLYWRQGYATEAANAVLAFGFDNLGLHRIWAQCIAENTAIIRVLERIGMREEGFLREHKWMKDRFWDTRMYAILDYEWKARRII